MTPEIFEPGIRVYCTSTCWQCDLAKRILDRVNVPYTLINIDQSPEAIELVRTTNHGLESVPTIFFRFISAEIPTTVIMTEPKNNKLEEMAKYYLEVSRLSP